MVALAGQLSGWPVFFRAGISTPVSVITILCGRKFLVVIATPTEESTVSHHPPIRYPLFALPGESGLDINAAINGLFFQSSSKYCRRDCWTPAEHVTLEGDDMIFNDVAGGKSAYQPSFADQKAVDWLLV